MYEILNKGYSSNNYISNNYKALPGPPAPAARHLRPVRLLRVWTSEGLTQADS